MKLNTDCLVALQSPSRTKRTMTFVVCDWDEGGTGTRLDHSHWFETILKSLRNVGPFFIEL